MCHEGVLGQEDRPYCSLPIWGNRLGRGAIFQGSREQASLAERKGCVEACFRVDSMTLLLPGCPGLGPRTPRSVFSSIAYA